MMPQDDSVYADPATRLEDLKGLEYEYRLRMHLWLEDCMAAVDVADDTVLLRAAAWRLGEASDADLRRVFADLPEDRRQHLLSVLLRVPVTEAQL
jgi:hypothetical protein